MCPARANVPIVGYEIRGFLKDAGLDLKAFQALQEERSAELERMVAQHKKDALRLAAQREVALALDCYNDSGNIDADFASGDFKIACPVVVFSLLNSPPGAMA